MKTKFRPLRHAKQVYYFEHSHGVLKNKKRKARYQAGLGMLVALFVFGGAGALGVQAFQARQDKSAANTLQRQAAPIDTSKKTSEEDTLKNVDKKAREDEQFAKKVKSKLKNIPGGQKWSVYIRDINSDRMVSVNADNSMEAANLSNLLVTVPLESKFYSDKWNYKAGNSTVAKCVEAIIKANDQNCRQSIDGYADAKNSEGVFNGLGLKKTVITAKDQKTSARDVGELLFRLQNGQGLSDKARRIVFDGLYGHKLREGIPSTCKQDCLAANITGESKTVRHDAAIVTDGGAQYVLVIMTNGGTWSQIADVAASIQEEFHP